MSAVTLAIQWVGDRLAELTWFVRDKTRVPSEVNGIVVDVGSGHSPHFRAHILIDKFPEDSLHRIGKPIVRRHKQCLVAWADVERLPIKDKSVDFIIASHLLEHLRHPDRALDELTRVSNAGYVECPERWSELLFPYDPHLWYVFQDKGRLIFEPKLQSRDRYLENVFLPALHHRRGVRYLFRDRDFWTVRILWKGTCPYTVTGQSDHSPAPASHDAGGRLVAALVSAVSKMVGIFARPNALSEDKILAAFCCPACTGDLNRQGNALVCPLCRCQYRYEDRTIDFEHPMPLA